MHEDTQPTLEKTTESARSTRHRPTVHPALHLPWASTVRPTTWAREEQLEVQVTTRKPGSSVVAT